jgi:hypothetical protein
VNISSIKSKAGSSSRRGFGSDACLLGLFEFAHMNHKGAIITTRVMQTGSVTVIIKVDSKPDMCEILSVKKSETRKKYRGCFPDARDYSTPPARCRS